MYAINSDSIDDSIERIDKIMYNGNKNGEVDVDSYKKGLSEINVLTSRLNDIDNLYTSSKKEPLFSPVAGVYLSEHSIDGGELTPKLSLKRKVILEKNNNIVEKLYKDAENYQPEAK